MFSTNYSSILHRFCHEYRVQHRVLTIATHCCMARRRRHLTNCNAAKTCWPEQSSSRTSAKPLLQSLHWLPNRERIRHKVATLTFKAHRMSSPPYLSSLLNDHIPSRTLRPSSMPRLIVPRTRTELAKRAFCVAAPSLWNSLPVDVVDTNTVLTFKKKHLKTYLYHCA